MRFIAQLQTAFIVLIIISSKLLPGILCSIIHTKGSGTSLPIQESIAGIPLHEGTVQRQIQINHDYSVEWQVPHNSSRIYFKVIVKTIGFIGFGITEDSSSAMLGSDIIIVGVYPNGTGYLNDMHGIGYQSPAQDSSQDYTLISSFENETHAQVEFSRLLNTCDEKDVAINNNTQKIVWSFGNTDQLSYHGSINRGSIAVNFLDMTYKVPDISQYKIWRTDVNMILPSNDTVYWCNFFKAPKLDKKHHIVGFDIFLNGTNALKHTHHADIYKCTAPNGTDPDEYFGKYLGAGYECYFSTEYFPVEHCQLFELQWSIGGQPTFFPEYVGLPIGESPSVYYMTEIHFNNPDKLENVQIHSGLEMYYTGELRQFDAGFLQIGSMTTKAYSLTVPPMSTNFVFSSHCQSECTDYIPNEGVNVFVYLLHSHLNSRKMRIRHFRDGNELPWIANDESYDFNFQNNRLLRNEIKLLPRDHLTLECTYDNTWKNGLSTLGGRSPREEMCQTFLMYYPRTLKVNQCGSYYSQEAMLKFMGIENATLARGEFDPIITAPASLAGLRYSTVIENHVNWTPEKRTTFQTLTRYGAQTSYCYPSEQKSPLASYPQVNQEYKPPNTCPV